MWTYTRPFSDPWKPDPKFSILTCKVVKLALISSNWGPLTLIQTTLQKKCCCTNKISHLVFADSSHYEIFNQVSATAWYGFVIREQMCQRYPKHRRKSVTIATTLCWAWEFCCYCPVLWRVMVSVKITGAKCSNQ